MFDRRRARTGGQALVEFAIILPILLTLFGAIVDVARVYQASNVLESATRDAAEYTATNDTTSAAAATDAATVICNETKALSGYVSSAAAPGGCSSPTVTISNFVLSSSAPGASLTHPVASVTVSTTLAFKTLFPYPLFTQGSAWTLRSTQAYSIVQGR